MSAFWNINTLFFLIIGLCLIGFTVFDGLNLGAGIVHLIVGRTDDERSTHFSAIGPFWFGYEVWLLAAGGSLVTAFPTLYAQSFSGFYIVLNIVLWLLMIRGTAIEYRHQMAGGIWKGFWDGAYSLSCVLLALVFGAAIGNVVRGVSQDHAHMFSWNLADALNPFALSVGVFNVVFLAMHGSLFIANKTSIPEHKERAVRVSQGAYLAMLVMLVVVVAGSLSVRPHILDNFKAFPLLLAVPILATAAAAFTGANIFKKNVSAALYGSSLTISFLLLLAVLGNYPSLLPDLGDGPNSMTIFNVAAPTSNLELGAAINILGLIIVVVYAIYVHKVFAGPINVSESGDHAY